MRMNIYNENNEFVGWFNKDAATLLADWRSKGPGPYVDYVYVYLTAGGKIIGEYSNNSGMREHYAPITGKDAVRYINEAGTDAGEKWANGKGVEFFESCEIK